MRLQNRPQAYPNTESRPTWSPDSRRVIAEVGSDTVVATRNAPSKTESFGEKPAWVNTPDWSPQGDSVAFSAHTPRAEGERATWGIYTCDSEGKNYNRILNDAKNPEYSPAGDRIAFTLYKSGTPERIAVADADGSNPTVVGGGGLQQTDLSWDPQGHQIAYDTYKDGRYQLRITDITGRKDRVISDGQGGLYKDRTPEWSPDGNTIMFERHNRVVPQSDLWTMDLKTGQQKQLTSLPGRTYDATWSPDGRRIAFLSTMEGGDETDLYLMDADGKNMKMLSGLPGDEHAPSWSPDGKALAFERLDWSKRRNDPERYSLHIIELE